MANMADTRVEINAAPNKMKCNQNYVSSHPTLITKDKRLAVCGCGNRLIIYSIKTGKLLRKLEGHDLSIVDFALRRNNPLQVLSAEKNGTIILWDITDGAVIKKMSVPYPISAMITHPSNDDIIYVVKEAMKKKKIEKQEPKYTLLRIDLGAPMRNKLNEIHLQCDTVCAITRNSNNIVFSQKGDVIAYFKGQKLQIISLKEKNRRKFGFEGKEFTSIAFHPSRMVIATGNTGGKIVIWSDFLDGNTPSAVQLHWHVHPVDTLSFTHDGLYLLSGGLENVLVMWQLATLRNDFLPRLGGQIKYISLSEDDQFASVTLVNNVVKVISLVNKRMTCILQGLSEASKTKTGLKLDPRSGCLVLSVIPAGKLQFYDPDKDSVLTTFDVVGQNYIVGPKRNAISMSHIDHFDFSEDGTWLATIERGRYKVIPDEVKLKFWRYDQVAHRYMLVTMAETPHDDRITCLKLRPKPEMSAYKEMAITAGSTGKFKCWVLEENEYEGSSGNVGSTWKCRSAFGYGSSSCGKASFSQDGSLLAVIYGKEVTIWDSETGKLRTSFYCPVQENFRDVIFGAGSSTPYLVARTTHYILCWNLLSFSMCWGVESKATAMAVDPISGYFAIATTHFKGKNKVCLLDASTSKVVLSMGRSGHTSKVTSMTFASNDVVNWTMKGKDLIVSKLYIFNSDKDIYKFGPEAEDRNKGTDDEVSVEEQVKSEFENIFGTLERPRDDVKVNSDIEKPTQVTPGNHSAAVIRKIVGTPSHVLPSVASLCSTFFKAVTLKHLPTEPEQESSDELENSPDDESSDGDDDGHDNKKKFSADVQENILAIQDGPQRTSEFSRTINFNWISDFISANYDS